MKRKILVLLSLQFSIYALFGQNITGKWYKVQHPNASLVINIEKNNDNYFGTFNWEQKDWINVVNAPLENLIIKDDSLLFELTYASFKPNFKLQKDNETGTYKGFFYLNGRQIEPVTLSRIPPERDMTIAPIVEKTYTRQDTLRGKITDERAWWNLTHYDLDFELDIENKFIKGSNTITYTVLESKNDMQIDLQPPLKITKVIQAGESLTLHKKEMLISFI